MYYVHETLQQLKKKFYQIPVAKILIHGGKWVQQKKGILVLILLGGIAFKFILGRPSVVTLQGETMRTPYHIQYVDRWGRNYQQEIDALLVHLHASLSNTLADSELSRFNKHDCSVFYFEAPFFYPMLTKSKEIYRNTAGAFDPTILPLVNALEGIADATDGLDTLQVNALREYVSLDYVVANAQRIKKLKEGVQLDFKGILKGYAVDQIVDLLHTRGIENMRIELGSKTVAHGQPRGSNVWYASIHPHVVPLIGDELQITLELMNKAVAISSRKKLSNRGCLIDPASGCPARHRLLAAVVVSKDCSTADAYATAMMVRGLAFAQELLAKEEGIAAFLIYEDERGAPAFYASPRLHSKKSILSP